MQLAVFKRPAGELVQSGLHVLVAQPRDLHASARGMARAAESWIRPRAGVGGEQSIGAGRARD
jgi:hypothetical protein